jgi:hypothetical protein
MTQPVKPDVDFALANDWTKQNVAIVDPLIAGFKLYKNKSFEKWMKTNISTPYATLKLWYFDSITFANGEFSIASIAELIKMLAATMHLFPNWDPPLLQDHDILEILRSLILYNQDMAKLLPHSGAITISTPSTPTHSPTIPIFPAPHSPISIRDRAHTSSHVPPSNPTLDPTAAVHALLQVVQDLQQQMIDMRAEFLNKGDVPLSPAGHQSLPPALPTALTHSPPLHAPTHTFTAPITGQDALNQELITTLKILQGEQERPTPKPMKVLPKHVLDDIVRIHDFPQANYDQVAAVASAKVLLELYQRGAPMGPTEEFNSLALGLTLSIKSSMTADAFPSNTRPLHKEKKALLDKIMGKDITKAELKEAYPTRTPTRQPRGRGGSSYTSGYSNRSSYGKQRNQNQSYNNNPNTNRNSPRFQQQQQHNPNSNRNNPNPSS